MIITRAKLVRGKKKKKRERKRGRIKTTQRERKKYCAAERSVAKASS